MEFSRFFQRLLLIMWLLAVTIPMIGVFFGALGVIFGEAGDIAAKSFLFSSAKFCLVLWGGDLCALVLLLVGERLFEKQ